MGRKDLPGKNKKNFLLSRPENHQIIGVEKALIFSLYSMVCCGFVYFFFVLAYAGPFEVQNNLGAQFITKKLFLFKKGRIGHICSRKRLDFSLKRKRVF